MSKEIVIDVRQEQAEEAEEQAATEFPKGLLVFIGLIIGIVLTFGGGAIYEHGKKPPEVETGVTIPAGGSVTYAIPSNSNGIWVVGTDDDEESPVKWSKAPKDAPPSKLMIGPHKYTVKYKKMTALGRTDRDKSVIYLRNDLSASQLRATLIHEIMHGCIAVGNWYGTRTGDEDVNIESIAPMFLMVIRDNPDLVLWLEKKEQ